MAYNLIEALSFEPNGPGRLVLGFGQLIFATIAYHHAVRQPGLLELTYVESPGNRIRTGGTLTHWSPSPGTTIEVPFRLRAGDFSGNMDTGTESGPFQYAFRWAMDLDAIPYSPELNLPPGFLARESPAGPVKTLYGHGQLFASLGGAKSIVPFS